MSLDEQDYLPSHASRKARMQRSESSDKRSTVGGRKISSHSLDEYDPHSDAQLKAVRASSGGIGESSTSRVTISSSSMTHICSSCRTLFRAKSRPIRGVCYLCIAMGIMLWCIGTTVTMVSTFWTVALCTASFIFVFMGSRQFYQFTQCPECGSEYTSRLDSAHGRQIQTETLVKTETSYIRNKI